MSIQLNRHLLTTEAYHVLGEAGLIPEGQRVELIRGEIFNRSPISSKHAFLVDELTHSLITQLGRNAVVRTQNPVQLNEFSEPEPDILLARPPRNPYQHRHPKPEEVLLLIEIADSSLSMDQTVKLPLYAEAQIPVYWIINIKNESVEVHTEPQQDTYRNRRIYSFAEQLTHPELPLQLRIADLLA